MPYSSILSSAVVGLLSLAPLPAQDDSSVREASLGTVVENFALGDQDDADFVLYDDSDQYAATVLCWTGVECPIAKLYLPRIAKLAKEYSELHVRFLGIDPNVQDTEAEVRERLAAAGVELKVLLDPMQVVTDRLGVVRTTEVILLDREHRIVYRGALDDQYDVGASRPAPRNHYLLDALEAVLAGEDVGTACTDAPGCLVGRITDPASLGIDFAGQVASILHKRCVDCHREGQIGPMSLVDCDEAQAWAPMIAEVLEQRRMPPWHADPRYGQFENRRILTETERAQLLAWVESGAPAGDLEKAPAAPEFHDDGWMIGEPDWIVELPKPQKIPADGVVPYQYVEVDPKLTEDRWVQAVEIHPTATAATHHALVLTIPPGQSMRDVMMGLRNDGNFVKNGYFAVQVPGNRPNVYPEGTGKFLAAGTKFLFQMHYTPTGIEEEDQTQLAMRWCEEPPKLEVKTMGVFTFNLDIPPGRKDATFYARYTFEKPIRLISMFPHMHNRGSAFRFEMIGGQEDRVLLDVPHYDFNWQNFYRPSPPVEIGAGETMLCTAVYDNSWDNPYNPDASERVRWGDQTFEEMMIGYLDYTEVPEGEAQSAGG